MSVKDDLNRAVLAMRGQPGFSDFIKTLTARRDAVNSRVINDPSGPDIDVLRGEVRGYNFIINAQEK